MKLLILSMLLLGFSSCKPPVHDNQALQLRMANLEKKLGDTYKPGLGEFMSGIQVHHAKLWFAGKNDNWELADFEVAEIKEALEDIRNYCADRPEVKDLEMINPVMDSISKAVRQKNEEQFKSSFSLLTHTCNNCHIATDHGFNVIKIPEGPPFSNQVFKVK